MSLICPALDFFPKIWKFRNNLEKFFENFRIFKNSQNSNFSNNSNWAGNWIDSFL